MALNVDRKLIDLFPEATYHTTSVLAGKWVTEHHIIDIKACRYTLIADNKTSHVDSNQWLITLNKLKEYSDNKAK